MGCFVADMWVCGACIRSPLVSYGGERLGGGCEGGGRNRGLNICGGRNRGLNICGGVGLEGGNRRPFLRWRTMAEAAAEEEEEKRWDGADPRENSSLSSSSSGLSSISKGFGFSSRTAEGKSNKASKGTKKTSSKRKGKQKMVGVEEGIGRVSVSDSLEQTVKNVERMAGVRKIGKSQTIDLDEAGRGKVDFAEIESWGQGADEKDLENLKVKSFSPSFRPADEEGLFYEQLVRRLQLLESKGEISVAKGKPLPPFERWRFRESTYLQFLTDQFAVHEALEIVIENLECAWNHLGGANENGITNDSEEELVTEGVSPSKAARAITIFRRSLGIFRSQALLADITAMRKVMAGSNDNDLKLEEGTYQMLPLPTTQTAAYVKYIQLMGNQGIQMDTQAVKAQHRLLAHIFAIHVAHLTTGMRVGAKAVEVLPALQKSGAVCFYRDYPPDVRDPLRTFMEAMNSAGEILGGKDSREQVMSEVLKALQKTSLLLAVIAVEEEEDVLTVSA